MAAYRCGGFRSYRFLVSSWRAVVAGRVVSFCFSSRPCRLVGRRAVFVSLFSRALVSRRALRFDGSFRSTARSSVRRAFRGFLRLVGRLVGRLVRRLVFSSYSFVSSVIAHREGTQRIVLS